MRKQITFFKMLKHIFCLAIVFTLFSCIKQQNSNELGGEIIPFKNEKGKWGYMREFSKEVLIPDTFDLAFPFNDGFAEVRLSSYPKWIKIDTLGNLVPAQVTQQPRYTRIYKDNKQGIYDNKTNKVVLPCKYDEVLINDSSTNYIIIENNKLKGVIDTTGREILPIKFDNIDVSSYSEGYFEVIKNEKAGIFDISGKEVLPVIYDKITDIDYKLGVFVIFDFPRKSYEEGGIAQIRVINKNREVFFKDDVRLPFGLEHYTDGLMVVRGKNGKNGFIDKKGKLRIPYMYDQCFGFDHGFAVVSNYRKDEIGEKHFESAVIDTLNNIVIPFAKRSIRIISDRLFIISSHKSGLFDRHEREIIPAKYQDIKRISENLFVAIDENNLYAIYNKDGKQIQPSKYAEIDKFSEGMAIVKDTSYMIGYINEQGEEVIPCKYRKASSFRNGAASVTILEKYGFVDKKGREYWIE